MVLLRTPQGEFAFGYGATELDMRHRRAPTRRLEYQVPYGHERPLSALCSRWLTTWRMGEDAPVADLPAGTGATGWKHGIPDLPECDVQG